MKHPLLLLVLILLSAKSVFAGSAREGDGRKANTENGVPHMQGSIGEIGPEAGMSASGALVAGGTGAKTDLAVGVPSRAQKLDAKVLVKPLKPGNPLERLREARKYKGATDKSPSEASRLQLDLDRRLRKTASEPNGDGNVVFGVLSLLFGLMGILFAVGLLALFALWPMVLMYSGIAIALGAIGLIRKGKGRELALGGLILGMMVFAPLTIGVMVYAIVHWKDRGRFF
jgi:hypothetical protein